MPKVIYCVHALRYVSKRHYSSLSLYLVCVQLVSVQAGKGSPDTGFGWDCTVHRLLLDNFSCYVCSYACGYPGLCKVYDNVVNGFFLTVFRRGNQCNEERTGQIWNTDACIWKNWWNFG